MRLTPGVPPLAWGGLLALNAIVLAIWASSSWWAAVPLAVSAVLALATGAALVRRAPRQGQVRPVADSSAFTAMLVPGLAMLALAPAAGLWLALLGAGVVVLALAGLAREWLDLRRRRRSR